MYEELIHRENNVEMSEIRTRVSRQNEERVVQCRMEFTVLSEGRPSHYTSTEFTPLTSLPSSSPQGAAD